MNKIRFLGCSFSTTCVPVPALKSFESREGSRCRSGEGMAVRCLPCDAQRREARPAWGREGVREGTLEKRHSSLWSRAESAHCEG